MAYGAGSQVYVGYIVETTPGLTPTPVSPVNEVQVITLTGTPTGGSFQLEFAGTDITPPIAWNAAASAVQTALRSLVSIGATGVGVTGSAGGPYTATFGGFLAGTNVPMLVLVNDQLTGAGAGVSINNAISGAAGTNEVQTLSLGGATSGSFTLTFNAATTAPIPFNDTAANIQIALRALSTINGPNVTVTGSVAGPFTITFIGTLQSTDVGTILLGAGSLVGASGESVVTATPGVVGTDEVDVVTLTGSPIGGTFTLTFGAQTTTDLAYNASSVEVHDAFVALSTVGVGNAAVTGGLGGPYTITFLAGLGSTNVGAVTATATSLVSAGSATITESVMGVAATDYTYIPVNPDQVSLNYSPGRQALKLGMGTIFNDFAAVEYQAKGTGSVEFPLWASLGQGLLALCGLGGGPVTLPQYVTLAVGRVAALLTYGGCKCKMISISAVSTTPVTVKLDFDFITRPTDAAIGTPPSFTTEKPFVWADTDPAILVGSTNVIDLDNIGIDINFNQVMFYGNHGNNLPSHLIPTDVEVKGKFSKLFQNTAEYNLFNASCMVPGEIQFSWTSGCPLQPGHTQAARVIFTMPNCIYETQAFKNPVKGPITEDYTYTALAVAGGSPLTYTLVPES